MRKAMRQRLQDEGFAGSKVAQLLVLPGHTLASTPVGFPRERIVDAKDAPELCHRVLRVINRGRQKVRIRPDGRAYCIFGETRTLSIAIYDRVQPFDMAGAHIMALVLAALAFVFAAGSARPLQKR